MLYVLSVGGMIAALLGAGGVAKVDWSIGVTSDYFRAGTLKPQNDAPHPPHPHFAAQEDHYWLAL
jgi:hypothetical protein